MVIGRGGQVLVIQNATYAGNNGSRYGHAGLTGQQANDQNQGARADDVEGPTPIQIGKLLQNRHLLNGDEPRTKQYQQNPQYKLSTVLSTHIILLTSFVIQFISNRDFRKSEMIYEAEREVLQE